MSHPFGASAGGPSRAPSDVLTPALADQEDPSLLLIEQIQAGIRVEESSRKLYHLHYRKVIAYFRKKRFSAEESRDLTQDVFSRVFKAIDTFRRESRFERWLFEIAANIYRNTLRGKKAEKRDAVEVPINVAPDDGGGGAIVDPASGEKSALDAIVERERREALREALRELPPQMRTCCELRYVHGLKYHEIARVMKISIETVKAHLHQARKRLLEKLGGDRGKL
jgi:RNA polymerase sigma-70 factor (ECF subfamily)